VTEQRGVIQVGVVGTGFSASCHLDALARTPGVEAVAIAGSDPERTARVAREHGVPHAYGSYDELLAHPGLGAVHNCTINRLHHEVSVAALGRGMHVLSEKPLAITREQSAALVAAADRAQVVAAVCFNYRYYPLVAQIRSMLAGGDHGRAHFVHGAYMQDWLLLPSDWNWRLDPVDGGLSRAVADIGSHWSDLAQHVTGDRIVEVFADLATLHPTRLRPSNGGATFSGGDGLGGEVPIHSEDHGTVLARFASGARGSFTVSQTSAGNKNGLSFQVDAGEAAFGWRQEDPNHAWIGRRDGPNLELSREPGTPHSRLPAGHPEGWLDALAALVRDFYDTARGGTGSGDLATFDDGHALVCLVEAVVESNREQRWARVSSSSEVFAS
jgi:predicted dehydrogenase